VIFGPQGQERHVLCFDQSYAERVAEDYYPDGPWKVVTWRSQQTVPAALATWRPRLKAFARAQAELGLTLPVKLKLTGHKRGRRGAHSLRIDNGKLYHHITVKNWLDPVQAGRTLWHELAHAMQAERAIAAAERTRVMLSVRERQQVWLQCSERTRKMAYFIRPCEVEARTFEANNDRTPLAQPV
jgi:hypothetical protein